MQKLIKRSLDHPFLSASLIMVIGSNVYSAGQFVFHIVAARILGEAYYGDAAALLNILGVFALFQASLGLTVVKFIASEKNSEDVSNLIKWSLRTSLYIGLVMCLVIIIFAPFINKFLNLSHPSSIYFLAPAILFYAIATVARSILQGLLKFLSYVFSLVTEIGVKLVLMIALVLAGYAVLGTMIALVIGVICATIIGLLPMKDIILLPQKGKVNIKPLIKYIVPAFLQGVALTSMYSTDLFLVKHYFSPETAGIYAAVTKLGSIVFFIGSPISNVMFPLVAKRQAHGESYHRIFYLSLSLVGLAAIGIIVPYFLFPDFFLIILGSNFLSGSHLLWWSGLFMGLLAASSLLIQFYLSIGKTFIVGVFLLAAVLQTILIVLFHNSLQTVIQMSIIATALLLLSLLVYFPYHDRK